MSLELLGFFRHFASTAMMNHSTIFQPDRCLVRLQAANLQGGKGPGFAICGGLRKPLVC
jgi:hypothetical protein